MTAKLLGSFVALCLATSARAEQITVTVTGADRGDVLNVRTAAGEEFKVRLAEIFAPAKEQPYYAESKAALEKLTTGKEVEIRAGVPDPNGHLIGQVYLGDEWVSYLVVKAGWAWQYKAVSKSARLAGAEKEAREAKRGLWRGEDPKPPWEFRFQSGPVI